MTVESLRTLFGNGEPAPSPVGIGLTIASLIIMPFLSWAQRRTGRALGSNAVVADSTQTLLCTYLSAVLVGLVLNATLGWAGPTRSSGSSSPRWRSGKASRRGRAEAAALLVETAKPTSTAAAVPTTAPTPAAPLTPLTPQPHAASDRSGRSATARMAGSRHGSRMVSRTGSGPCPRPAGRRGVSTPSVATLVVRVARRGRPDSIWRCSAALARDPGVAMHTVSR
ncbi:hypothetical protein [Modestobacter sp. DSM 44400]|uniref:hypothetical protein n=1 Tax=Modestobacter sp. DSM 44400 TaxID=1550230 RepID=UPI0020C8A71E|nr:hypothetical protein [Modestobacter sp. DSM 44400]